MGREIERKWRVDAVPPLGDGSGWRARRVRQGYLAITGDVEVRVRRFDEDDAWLTVKSAPGLSRVEEELPLDGAAFDRLWALTAGRRVEKVRHTRAEGDVTLELDVYSGTLSGLAVLEVEFAGEDAARAWTPPEWVGRELTGDKAYANQTLALRGRP
jgi:adenylate cyclase